MELTLGLGGVDQTVDLYEKGSIGVRLDLDYILGIIRTSRADCVVRGQKDFAKVAFACRNKFKV